jgi:hypothetical protein
MKKNVASQHIGSQMITAADGTAFTSTVTVYVTGDNGTQTLGSVGSGVCVSEGNGFHSYEPAQAETNYDFVAFTFIGTGAIPSTVEMFTSFPQTVDNATNISAILTDTAEIGVAGAGLTNIPWNASWDAEVQSEVNDGLVAFWTSPAALVDLVWDEVLIGATHNVNNSSGKRLRQVATTVFSQGTAQSATANQIQLASGAISLDGQFVRSKVIIVDGTGVNQEAIITDSVASTDTLTISPSWLVTPDATSLYEVTPAQSHSTIRNGGYDNGAVYVDVSGGTTGVLVGVNGISDKPVLTLAEARIIADEIDVQKFVFDRGIGLPTLDQDYVGWRFEVRSATAFNLNSRDVSFSVFDRATVTGTALNTSGVTVYETCGIIALTCGESNFIGCGLISSLTMNQVNKRYSANNLFSNGTIGTIPEIIFSGDGISPIFFEAGATGEYVIKGMTAVDTLQMMGQCIITLDSTCVGGTVITSGDVAITDNSTGGAVVFSSGMTRDILTDTATTIPATIATAQADLDIITGADGVNLLSATQATIDAIPTAAEVNAEIVDALVTDTYAEPSAVPAATASLKDKIGFVNTMLRNKMTQTATTTLLRNDGDTLTIGTSTVSDDTTTFTRGKQS